MCHRSFGCVGRGGAEPSERERFPPRQEIRLRQDPIQAGFTQRRDPGVQHLPCRAPIAIPRVRQRVRDHRRPLSRQHSVSRGSRKRVTGQTCGPPPWWAQWAASAESGDERKLARSGWLAGLFAIARIDRRATAHGQQMQEALERRPKFTVSEYVIMAARHFDPGFRSARRFIQRAGRWLRHDPVR